MSPAQRLLRLPLQFYGVIFVAQYPVRPGLVLASESTSNYTGLVWISGKHSFIAGVLCSSPSSFFVHFVCVCVDVCVCSGRGFREGCFRAGAWGFLLEPKLVSSVSKE